MEVYAVGKWTL